MDQSFKSALKAVYIVFVLVMASYAIGLAAEGNMLIPAAIPFAAGIILLVRFLGSKPELLAWAGFTVWLGSTYIASGTWLEYVLFATYVILAALGIFKSPYFLAIAWLFHPAWDFIPRELPEPYQDLPMACVLFDTPIGLYLLGFTWAQRWRSFGEVASSGAWYSFKDTSALAQVGKSIYVAMLLILVSFAAALSVESGLLVRAALPCAILLILGLRLVGNRAELIAWAIFTGWLGMTYAHTGGAMAIAVFFVSVIIAALGVFKSPYYLAFAWLASIPWNFMPHDLPEAYSQLPVALTLFALPVALYFFWTSKQSYWDQPNMSGQDNRPLSPKKTP